MTPTFVCAFPLKVCLRYLEILYPKVELLTSTAVCVIPLKVFVPEGGASDIDGCVCNPTQGLTPTFVCTFPLKVCLRYLEILYPKVELLTSTAVCVIPLKVFYPKVELLTSTAVCVTLVKV